MSTESLQSPSDAEFESFFQSALRDGAVITVYANCEVVYRGRTGSSVGPGDRVVMVKPDRTVLVHRTTGRNPMNWQPAGSHLSVSTGDAGPELLARNTNPSEHLKVTLREIHQVTRYDATDTAVFEEYDTEAEMHRYIEEHPDAIEDGLRIVEHERATPYGHIDFFATDARGRSVVVEVKRKEATLNDFDQLNRYVSYYREERDADADRDDVDASRDDAADAGASRDDAADAGASREVADAVRGVLVAPRASDRVKRTIRDHGFEFVRLAEHRVEERAFSETRLTDFE